MLTLRPLLALAVPRFAVLQRLPIPGDDGWDYMTFDAPSHRLFVARATHVQVMDVRTGRIVGDVPNTPGVHGVALVPELQRGFASAGGANEVVVFDLRTLAEVARIKAGTNPDAIVYDPASRRVLAMNGRSANVSVIDPKAMAVVGTIPVAGKPEFAAPDGRGDVYVNIEDRNLVQRLDPRALSLTGTWTLDPGEEPTGLAYGGDRVFSVCANGRMTILDPKDGELNGAPIGGGPDAAAYDPGLGLAFSSNGGDGTLTVVHAPDGAVVQTLPTQPSARTMALDPKAHRLYLIAAEVAPPAPGERRGKVKPGTATILVVGRA